MSAPRIRTAIAESAQTDSIVHVAAGTLAEYADLVAVADDYCIDGERCDAWGADWRVALGLVWWPADMAGGTGDGRPLPVPGDAPRHQVADALAEWLAEGDWGHDDGPDIIAGCAGSARRTDWTAGAHGLRVKASIRVTRSTGEWERD